jgi:hypothetical protein
VANSHGSTGVLKLTSGGSLRDISSYVTTTGIQRELDKAETTTLGSVAKTYIAGLPDGTIPVDGLYDPTVDGYIYTVYSASPGFAGTAFEYYPAGTASTSIKYSGSCIVTKYEIKTDVGDANQFNCELQITGAITRAVV